MRKSCLLTLLAWLGITPFGNTAHWMSDHPGALARAYGENRMVLINFTGSDWCAPCIRLRQEVFSKPEFHAYADNHLVLLEVYVARYKPQTAVTWALMQKYGVGSVPTMILVDTKGVQIGRIHSPGGPEAFIQTIQQMIARRERKSRPAVEPPAVEPEEPLPMFSGAPTGPAPKYKELTLKSISGAGAKKLALINNQTLGVGESAKVRLGTGEIKLRCEEIRAKSVIVTLEGRKPERKELRLKDG